jgi:hypothetical protein
MHRVSIRVSRTGDSPMPAPPRRSQISPFGSVVIPSVHAYAHEAVQVPSEAPLPPSSGVASPVAGG